MVMTWLRGTVYGIVARLFIRPFLKTMKCLALARLNQSSIRFVLECMFVMFV